MTFSEASDCIPLRRGDGRGRMVLSTRRQRSIGNGVSACVTRLPNHSIVIFRNGWGLW
jgi:hypothetical protein